VSCWIWEGDGSSLNYEVGVIMKLVHNMNRHTWDLKHGIYLDTDVTIILPR
jgi:hypothetical protein